MDTHFTCPHCHTPIDLSEVQENQLALTRETMERDLKALYEQKNLAQIEEVKLAGEKREQEMKIQMWARAQEAAAKKNEEKLLELDALKAQDALAREQNLALMRERNELITIQKNMDLEYEKRAFELQKTLEESLKKEADARALFELERARLEFEKREQEMSKKMDQMQRSIEEANRKANQGSMQIQGDAQETQLKTDLIEAFPLDRIEDVPTGVKGADIVQGVIGRSGIEVGVIAWEAKMTKEWKDAWTTKLKEDRLRVGATISIIVTAVLPKGINHFGLYQGVWVTLWAYARPLAELLRTELIQMHSVKGSLVAKDEKMEILYNYLTSSEFGDKINNIIDAFDSLREDLVKEKRAMEAIWARREKQLDRIIGNTSRLNGDMQGLLGKNAVHIPALDMPSED